jgi:hypothetical protein
MTPLKTSSNDYPVGWKGTGAHEHFVQFFEQDAALVESARGFLGGGLLAGAACIVIATADQRHAIERGLIDSGFDLESARQWNQYVSLDASETLARFMVDGRPDAQKFAAIIGPEIAKLETRHERVLALGTMVAVLASDGQHAAAVELEKLWNKLAEHHRFSLFCAYPAAAFRDECHAQALLDVCAQHSATFGSGSFPPGTVEAMLP